MPPAATGILSAFVVSLLVTIYVPGGGWRLMMRFSVLVALLQCACVSILPESPRWLLRRGNAAAARRALAQARGVRGRPECVAAEFAEMESAMAAEKADDARHPGSSGFASLREPAIRRLLVVCVTLQMLQQFSGINAIVYYTPQTMK